MQMRNSRNCTKILYSSSKSKNSRGKMIFWTILWRFEWWLNSWKEREKKKIKRRRIRRKGRRKVPRRVQNQAPKQVDHGREAKKRIENPGRNLVSIPKVQGERGGLISIQVVVVRFLMKEDIPKALKRAISQWRVINQARVKNLLSLPRVSNPSQKSNLQPSSNQD